MTGPASAGPTPDSSRLRVPRDRLAWFTDAGETAVHDGFSGRTHQLDPAASLIFTALLDHDMTPEALRARLAERLQVAPAELDGEAMARLLSALEAAGLIEKAPA